MSHYSCSNRDPLNHLKKTLLGPHDVASSTGRTVRIDIIRIVRIHSAPSNSQPAAAHALEAPDRH